MFPFSFSFSSPPPPPPPPAPTLPHVSTKPRAPVLHYNLNTPPYPIGPADLLFASLFIRCGLCLRIDLGAGGQRRVAEIVAVPGRAEGDTIETEPLYVRTDGGLQRQGGRPPRPERFERAGIDLAGLLRGSD